jgi:hypothetical protein
MALEILVVCRHDIAWSDPQRTAPSVDSVEPKRAKVLIDRDEDCEMKLNTLMAPPKFTRWRTLTDEPNCVKSHVDTADPNRDVRRSDILEPTFKKSDMLRLEPARMKDLMEQLEPRVNTWMVDRYLALPITITPCVEILEAASLAQARTDSVLPIEMESNMLSFEMRV